jgi:hypothetical protein
MNSLKALSGITLAVLNAFALLIFYKHLFHDSDDFRCIVIYFLNFMSTLLYLILKEVSDKKD